MHQAIALNSFLYLYGVSVGTTNSAGTTCAGAIVASSGVPDNAWIVGDTLMKNTYTVFDEANSVSHHFYSTFPPYSNLTVIALFSALDLPLPSDKE